MARTYLVECYWPGVTEAAYSESVARLRSLLDQNEEARDTAPTPEVAQYLDSLLMPADEAVFYRLAAESATAVEEVCARASVRFERVTEYVGHEST